MVCGYIITSFGFSILSNGSCFRCIPSFFFAFQMQESSELFMQEFFLDIVPRYRLEKFPAPNWRRYILRVRFTLLRRPAACGSGIFLGTLILISTLQMLQSLQQQFVLTLLRLSLRVKPKMVSHCSIFIYPTLVVDRVTILIAGGIEARVQLLAVRPPGHHAGVSKSTGFCLHNNAAVAASAAKEMSAKKILILDWDVHHGNGTQEIFDADRSVLYISIHRFDRGKFYPPTGAADKVGVKGAKGYSVNIPWNRAGVGDCDYLSAFKHIVIPIARQFSPELTIVSAGFDAARGDPLGLCDVTPRYYAEMTSMLASICGKLLVILEGGYNLRSISASAKAVVEVLLGGDPAGVRKLEPSISGLETIREVLRHPK